MVEKIQRPILGSIFTIAVIVLIIFFAFIWGRVVLLKNADTSKVNTMISNLEELDSTIRKVAETKQTQVVEVGLENIEMQVVTDDIFQYDVIQMRAETVTPVLSFVAWIPVNSRKLPYQTDRFIQYMKPQNATYSCFTGIPGQVKANKLKMYGTNYTVYSKITGEEQCPIYVCLKEDRSKVDCESSCGCETEVISDLKQNYLITYASEDVVEIGGKLRELEGIQGQDIPGIILGKAERFGKENMNTLYLVYRTMDNNGLKSRINLNCLGDCTSYGKLEEVRISFGSEITEGDLTTYNLQLSIGD